MRRQYRNFESAQLSNRLSREDDFLGRLLPASDKRQNPLAQKSQRQRADAAPEIEQIDTAVIDHPTGRQIG